MKFFKLDRKQMTKSIVYRIYAFIITFATTFFVTGNVELSITLGILENVFKILTYYWLDIVTGKQIGRAHV